MRVHTGPVRPFLFAFFAALFFLTGCSAIGLGRSPGPSSTVQGISDDYRQAQLQTAATEEALEAIAIAPDPDLQQAFDFFTAHLALMEQIGTRLIAHADGMFYRGNYYFVESGKSLEACAFPRVGRLEDRLPVDLGGDFEAISRVGGEIKRDFRAFQFDIEQIRDILTYNLTPAGVDSMEQMRHKAEIDSKFLEEALRKALGILEHAKTVLQQQGAQQKG